METTGGIPPARMSESRLLQPDGDHGQWQGYGWRYRGTIPAATMLLADVRATWSVPLSVDGLTKRPDGRKSWLIPVPMYPLSDVASWA